MSDSPRSPRTSSGSCATPPRRSPTTSGHRCRDEDADSVAYLCEHGMTLAVATDDDLAALRSAVQPVYDEIASDPATAAWLEPDRGAQRRGRRAARHRRVPCDRVDGRGRGGWRFLTGRSSHGDRRGHREGVRRQRSTTSSRPSTGSSRMVASSTSFRSTTEPSKSASRRPTPWFAIASRSSNSARRRRSRSTGRSTARSSSCPISPTTSAIAPHHGVWESHPWVLVEDDLRPARRAHNTGDHRGDIGPDHVRPTR